MPPKQRDNAAQVERLLLLLNELTGAPGLPERSTSTRSKQQNRKPKPVNTRPPSSGGRIPPAQGDARPKKNRNRFRHSNYRDPAPNNRKPPRETVVTAPEYTVQDAARIVQLHTRLGILETQTEAMFQRNRKYVAGLFRRAEQSITDRVYCRPCQRESCEFIASTPDQFAAHTRAVHSQAIAQEIAKQVEEDPRLQESQARIRALQTSVAKAMNEHRDLKAAIRDALWTQALGQARQPRDGTKSRPGTESPRNATGRKKKK